jgi:dihydrofolate reductase
MEKAMRKLIVTEFVSLDGVMEAPGGEPGYAHAGWVMPFFTDELGAYKYAEQAAADILLLGRTTYESFYGAWPHRDDPMADKINSMTKYVVLTTLGSSDWHDTTVIATDVAPAVGELKASDGGPILVAGSRTVSVASRCCRSGPRDAAAGRPAGSRRQQRQGCQRTGGVIGAGGDLSGHQGRGGEDRDRRRRAHRQRSRPAQERVDRHRDHARVEADLHREIGHRRVCHRLGDDDCTGGQPGDDVPGQPAAVISPPPGRERRDQASDRPHRGRRIQP